MVLRLKYLAAACTLWLAVGTANASTFAVSGEFDGFSGHVYTCSSLCEDIWSAVPRFMAMMPAQVSGTLTFSAGSLTAVDLTVPGVHFTNPLGIIANVSPDELNWSAEIHQITAGPVYQTDLLLTSFAGILTASLFQVAQPGFVDFDSYVGNFTNFHGTATQMPLPGALPLFASGLGALVLLGWQRKRKFAA